MHAVQALYQYRKSLSTTTFNARGKGVTRCQNCRLSVKFCLCSQRVLLPSQAGFLLLMYDTEVLKPSNTGKLIADLIPDTYAFLWSRTQTESALLELLTSEKWQPYIVFPAEYANENQQVFHQQLPQNTTKRPLFILLDGSWREAKKMFRKSDYLQSLPILSIDPQVLISEDYLPKYQIRNSVKKNQLATAEVAAQVLDVFGERKNAQLLDCWFDLFTYQYQRSVCQTNTGDASSQSRYNNLVRDYPLK